MSLQCKRIVLFIACCLSVTACTSATSGKYVYRPAEHPLSMSPLHATNNLPAKAPTRDTAEQNTALNPAPTSQPSANILVAVSAPDESKGSLANIFTSEADSTPDLNPLTVFPKRSSAESVETKLRSDVRMIPDENSGIPLNPLTVFSQQKTPEPLAKPQDISRDNAIAKTRYIQASQPDNTSSSLSTDPSPTIYNSLLQWIATQPDSHRAQATINDPIFGSSVVAQLDGDYFAASGLYCRRVRLKENPSESLFELVAVCKDQDGEWTLAPRVGNNRVNINR